MGRSARYLIADRRGAVSFEVPLLWLLLMFSVLLPLADVATAGFQYVSAKQALRNFGQYIVYNPPPDVGNASSWATTAATKANTADSRFPISNLQVYCIDKTTDAAAICTSANASTSPVKYFSYNTTITLVPIVLKSVLCPGNNCTVTVPYSSQFQ